MSSKLAGGMTRAEFDQISKELDTPIDFDALIEAGVLEKQGAWYRVRDFSKLPSHARRKVKEIKLDKDKKVVGLKFYKVKVKR